MRLILETAIALAVVTTNALAGDPPFVIERTTQIGTIFADREGMTLYTYAGDGRFRPNCLGGCAQEWRPFIAAEGLCSDGDWVVITRSDGLTQWTYAGKPLYSYAGDSEPGDMAGQGMGDGAWQIAKRSCFGAGPDGEARDAEALSIVDAALEEGIEPVQKLRRSCGLSLGELARMAGITRADLHAHEDGSRDLSQREAAAVGNALGVPFYMLLQ